MRRYRPDIDGLRAIAVAAVVAYHAFPDAVPGGFAGVDVFFVVSGYLITDIVSRGQDDGTFRVVGFYARRVRRLFPALAITLAASLVLGWLVLLPVDYGSLGRHTFAGAAFVSNFALWSEAGYFDRAAETKPLLHLWSLAIEEQFYLAWPLLLLVARRLRVPLVVLALGIVASSFALNLSLVSRDAAQAFYMAAPRAWELALGALVLQVRVPSSLVRNAAAIAGLLVVLGSFFVLARSDPYPGRAAAMPTIGTALVLLAGAEAWSSKNVLAQRAVVAVGLVSYPLYLFHWPLLVFARMRTIDPPSGGARVLAVAIACVAAAMVYAWIERPIRAGRGGRRTIAALACAIALLGAIGLFVRAEKGFPSRLPPSLREIVGVAWDPKAGIDLRCSRDDESPTWPAECRDDTRPGRAFLVWGDSHAARLAVGMRNVMPDVRIPEYTRNSCAPLLVPGRCAEANAFVLRTIGEIRPDVVVIHANWLLPGDKWGRDDDLGRALVATVRAVREKGAPRVVVVGPVAQWRGDLPRVLAVATLRDVPAHRVPRRLWLGVEPKVATVDDALASLLADVDGVAYVSARKLMCDAEGCLTRVDDEPDGLTSFDYGHLTTKGATWLVRAYPLDR